MSNNLIYHYKSDYNEMLICVCNAMQIASAYFKEIFYVHKCYAS